MTPAARLGLAQTTPRGPGSLGGSGGDWWSSVLDNSPWRVARTG